MNTTNTDLILHTMLEKDTYSRWLGIEVDEFRAGYCKLHFTIRPEMLNGFSIVHGGIIFSASDSAFAFACNSQGIISVALDVHITFIKTGKVGDIMTIEAKEIHTGNKTSFYDIITTNQQNEIVATFRGTAYRTGKSVISEQV
jgi:acyl-CoA thioesterase